MSQNKVTIELDEQLGKELSNAAKMHDTSVEEVVHELLYFALEQLQEAFSEEDEDGDMEDEDEGEDSDN